MNYVVGRRTSLENDYEITKELSLRVKVTFGLRDKITELFLMYACIDEGSFTIKISSWKSIEYRATEHIDCENDLHTV